MNSLHDFHGGIYPRDYKQISTQSPIAPLLTPPQLVLPLRQHNGFAATPVVNVGDKVAQYQCLAKSDQKNTLPIHAPLAGTITAISEEITAHHSGLKETCITITPNSSNKQALMEPWPEFKSKTKSELIMRIFNAGVAGLGGAGFPTNLKINYSKRIDTLIINGVECEPLITSDDALMREHTKEILSGIAILKTILEPKRIVIAIESNKAKALDAFQRIESGSLPIEVIPIPTKYPAGGEKQLIEIITGQQVPFGTYPGQLGVFCQNIGTVFAIHEAIIKGIPLVKRVTTLTGKNLKNAHNRWCWFGTPCHWLIENALDVTPAEIIMGGPLMGFKLPHNTSPVVKITNCLIAEPLKLPEDHLPCIRCGVCADVCPASLLPQQLYWMIKAEKWPETESHYLQDCIECGACAYVCPSKIPLVDYYRFGKHYLKHKKEETKKSDIAKERFEFRNERLAQIEKEKEERRQKALELRAKNSDVTKNEIAEAVARAKAKKDQDL